MGLPVQFPAKFAEHSPIFIDAGFGSVGAVPAWDGPKDRTPMSGHFVFESLPMSAIVRRYRSI